MVPVRYQRAEFGRVLVIYGDCAQVIVLRQDQQQLKSEIYSGWNNGARNVLAVAPTGFGKSVVLSDIIQDNHQQGAIEAVIAHRVELVGQLSEHIANRGIKHRIIAPKNTVAAIIANHRERFNGRSYVSPDANCSVVAVDTMNARAELLASWAHQVDCWTIDEAHHVLRTNKWGKAVAMFPNARGLGVTASPTRMDGYGLGEHADGVFHHMVCGPDMRTLIDMGALCDYEIVCPESDLIVDEADFSANGDLSPKKGREASKRSHIVGDIVKEYCKYALGKRAIVFVTDVETAGEVANNFNAYGIAAAAVSAETPGVIRDDLIKRFKDGRLRVLVNVDLFGEGFDVPAVEVVIMARPTASLAVYLQQFGRALRTLAGKLYGLIIDMVSNLKRHGFPDKAHYWSLDRRDKRAKKEKDPDDVPITVCRNCSRPYERFHIACPFCGHEPPLPDGGVRSLEQVDGDLVLLDRETLEAMRKATILETPGSLASRVAFAAGENAAKSRANAQMARFEAQERLRNAVAQWAAIERTKGLVDRHIHKKLFLASGVDLLTALSLPRQDMDGLAARIEGWYSS
jgi:DNA repair protein RadD